MDRARTAEGVQTASVGRYASPGFFGYLIGREERLDPEFLQRHVPRRAERHDRAEDAQFEVVRPNMNRQQQIAGADGRRASLTGGVAGIAAQLSQQCGGDAVVARGSKLSLRPAKKMVCHLVPVDNVAP